MKIKFIATGKMQSTELLHLTDFYAKRIKPYIPFESITVPAARHTQTQKALQEEYTAQKKHVSPGDMLILLDETGTAYTSVAFAKTIRSWQDTGTKQVVFITGGAYGFHPDAYGMAHAKIRLSDMTFPHELVRVLFLEQLYRAFTIMHNQPYHH
ncbi:MAG: 23S rRNA (pseudouridine(1915)-N(3))-methyltransferase RlmH [Chitinophagales bacterium]